VILRHVLDVGAAIESRLDREGVGSQTSEKESDVFLFLAGANGCDAPVFDCDQYEPVANELANEASFDSVQEGSENDCLCQDWMLCASEEGIASERDFCCRHAGELVEGEIVTRSDGRVAEENETDARDVCRRECVEVVLFEGCGFDPDRFHGTSREDHAPDFADGQGAVAGAYVLAYHALLHEVYVVCPPRASSAYLSPFSLLPIAFSAPRTEHVPRPSFDPAPHVRGCASVSARLVSPCRMRRPQSSPILCQMRVPFSRVRLSSLLRWRACLIPSET